MKIIKLIPFFIIPLFFIACEDERITETNSLSFKRTTRMLGDRPNCLENSTNIGWSDFSSLIPNTSSLIQSDIKFKKIDVTDVRISYEFGSPGTPTSSVQTKYKLYEDEASRKILDDAAVNLIDGQSHFSLSETNWQGFLEDLLIEEKDINPFIDFEVCPPDGEVHLMYFGTVQFEVDLDATYSYILF